ncbi:MAG: glucose-1-phosphate thymidylyltransferase [Dehalococcoidia bacterium]
MKALVLSGGKGTRLRPFTYTGAKQLVPIANKPILFYVLEDLVSCGITDIAIVVGDTKDEVMAAVGDGSRFGAAASYIHQPVPLGIAHGIQIGREFLGASPFILYLGDNFLQEGIQPYVQAFLEGRYHCQVLLCPVENPQDFGVAELDGGRLVRLVEKPREPPSDLAVIGIYMFDSHVFEAVDAIRPSARGELEITDTIQYLIDKGLNVHADVVRGRWIDTGKHDDLLVANRAILESLERKIAGNAQGATLRGQVVLQEGSEVIDSIVDGPAIIGERTRVLGSYIGPFTSIYHDCLISDSEISGSVVLENTQIEAMGHRIEHSLIGRNVELRGADRRPRSYTLVLGDFSKVRVP